MLFHRKTHVVLLKDRCRTPLTPISELLRSHNEIAECDINPGDSNQLSQSRNFYAELRSYAKMEGQSTTPVNDEDLCEHEERCQGEVESSAVEKRGLDRGGGYFGPKRRSHE